MPGAAWTPCGTALAAHVTAARYRSRLEVEGRRARAAVVGRTLVRGLAFSGAAAAVVGLRFHPRWSRWAIVLLAAAGIAFGLRYATEDVDVFLLPAVLAMALAAAGSVRAAEGNLGQVAATLLAAALVAIPLASNFSLVEPPRRPRCAPVSRPTCWPRSRRPPRSSWRGTTPSFSPTRRRSTSGPSSRSSTGAAFLRQRGVLRPQPFRRGAEGARGRRGRAGRAAGVLHELARAELPSGWRFELRGSSSAPCADAPPGDDAALWSGYHEAAIAGEAGKRPGVFADAVAATYPLMRAEEALAGGRTEEAARQMEQALARAPRSETVLNTIGT